MDNKQARYLHQMLDRVSQGRAVLEEEIRLLRSFLPELPAQKTLEEIAWDIHFAWCETSGNGWKEEMFGDLETWLLEQHSQIRAHLEGVKSQAHPALPDGMRIAEHENFGRVVVSPGVGIDRCHEIFYLDPGFSSGTDISGVEPESLTFLDEDPTHPEFLETEADYANAPEGTIVAGSGKISWAKEGASYWTCSVGAVGDCSMTQSKPRRVLRWGWGHE